MEYDCQQCGACCVDYFGTEGYIQLNATEIVRMRRLGLPVIQWNAQPLLGTRKHDGSGGETCCVAFAGKVGSECACTIHPDRPRACREFEAGSLGCRFARQEVGLPV